MVLGLRNGGADKKRSKGLFTVQHVAPRQRLGMYKQTASNVYSGGISDYIYGDNGLSKNTRHSHQIYSQCSTYMYF